MGRMQVHEFAEPIVPSGSGDVGVLFLHGFTASPWTLREWATRTAADGYRVSVPGCRATAPVGVNSR